PRCAQQRGRFVERRRADDRVARDRHRVLPQKRQPNLAAKTLNAVLDVAWTAGRNPRPASLHQRAEILRLPQSADDAGDADNGRYFGLWFVEDAQRLEDVGRSLAVPNQDVATRPIGIPAGV